MNGYAATDNDGKHTLRGLRFDEAKGLLLIEYTLSAGNTLLQNQIYVDPGHNWRGVEHRVETPTLVTTETWSYGVMVGGLEFPSELKNRTMYKVAKAPPNLEITERLLNLKITDKTPDAFRLSV